MKSISWLGVIADGRFGRKNKSEAHRVSRPEIFKNNSKYFL